MKTKLPDPPAGVASAKFHRRPLLRGAFLAAALCAVQIQAARAQSPSPYTAHTVPSSLQTQVTSLTNAATTQQQKLRAATLQWALTQAAFLFTNTTELNSGNPGNPIDRTVSIYPGDTTTRQAPLGVTSGTTYDLRYSPLGLGDGLVADVSDNLASHTQIGNPNTTAFPYGSGGYNLSPVMPNFSTASGTFKNYLATQAGDYTSYFVGKSLATDFTTDDREVVTAEVFTHPDYAGYKALYGNPGLVNFVFNCLEYYAERACRHVAPDQKGSVDGSFQDSINFSLPYLLVSGRFPDLILPSMKTWWQASIYRNLTLDYAYDVSSSNPMSSGAQTPDKQFLGNTTENVYSNNDFRRMEGMYYASIIFQNNPSYPNVTTNVRNAIYHYIGVINSPGVIYGDGGITYGYHSNPLQEYEDSGITPLSNMFVILKGSTVTADQTARATLGSMLSKTWLFYPIQWNYAGDRESVALEPPWKLPGDRQTQNYELHGMLPTLNPELPYGNLPQVWRVFDENYPGDVTSYGTLLAAAFDQSQDPFLSDLNNLSPTGPEVQAAMTQAAAYDPNDYYGYDQNYAGPTSRFGLWREFGSARPNITAGGRGPANVVSFLLHETAGATDFAELIHAGGSVWTSTTSENANTDNSGRSSTIVTPTFASVVTQTGVLGTATSLGNGNYTADFEELQEWILTPHHMVGLNTLRAPDANMKAFAVGTLIQLNGSTGVADTGRTPHYNYCPDGSNGYRLNVKVWDNAFGTTNPGSSGTDGVRLYDTGDVSLSKSQVYPQGDIGHTVVDIHPSIYSDQAASNVVTGVTGLYGMDFGDGADHYLILHNTTASNINYTVSLPSSTWGTGSVLLHHAEIPAVYGSPTVPDRPEVVGETYRPAWMNTSNRSSLSSVVPTAVAISGGAATVTVPAYSHVVLTKIVGIVDGGIYELEPRSAPGSRLHIVGSGTANGTFVELDHRTGYTDEQWLAVSQGGGVFRFVSANSPTYLDVLNDGTANGTQVVISTDGTTPGKQWTPAVQADGAIEFTPGCAPGSVLESYDHNTNDGNKIEIWQDGHYTNQQFNVMRMNPVLNVGAIPPQ